MGFPTIDVQEIDYSGLREACENWGCFRMTNHGISLDLMARMKQTVRSLLDKPSHIKQRNTDVILGSGYMAPSKINPLYEALGLYDMASAPAVSDFCDQLDASTNQRETIEKYAEAVSQLSMDIARAIAQSYGVSGDLFEGWPHQFRINKYNFRPESVGMPGVQLHTDSGFLTILQEDENVGGLEVMNSFGVFVPVVPSPGTLLANLGDMAAIWSNRRLLNVKHRVQCKEAATRISIATFLLGPKEDAIKTAPEFVDTHHPRLYDPITYEGLRKLRFETKKHAGEALDDLLIHHEN